MQEASLVGQARITRLTITAIGRSSAMAAIFKAVSSLDQQVTQFQHGIVEIVAKIALRTLRPNLACPNLQSQGVFPKPHWAP
jgi:uncharacterized protein YlxW (UPF0749 family)